MSVITESIVDVCQQHGLQFRKQGGELYASCPFHADGKRPNFRVNAEKNTWYCDACNEGGGVVEFVAKKQGRDKKEVFKELAAKNNPPSAQAEIVATYDYTDQMGKLLYQVCRMNPKTFRQRHPDGKGGWIWNMQGINRVLYRMPELLRANVDYVWIVEGEKDVETLRGVGLTATCNVGGAGKWSDAYSEVLKGKNIVLCGDNDDAGRKHMQSVMESVEAFAKSIRKIELPAAFKDVSDMAKAASSPSAFQEQLEPLIAAAAVMVPGGLLPIKSMAELELEYIEHVESAKTRTVDLSKWLPSLRSVRPLVGGELVAIVGDTGTAKTYVLQHLAYWCGVQTLLFELELPGSLTFERFLTIVNQTSGREVWNQYAAKNRMSHGQTGHIFTCTKSRVTPSEIESLILKSELKIGLRPTLVLVDYIQLVQSTGKSRYERVSDVAEQLKIVAKSTGTVIVLASQVGRDKDEPEVHLHDAKDSGSIENSSGVVIGIWRDAEKTDILNIRVLKNTRGGKSEIIPCQISEGMCIREKAKFDPDEIP